MFAKIRSVFPGVMSHIVEKCPTGNVEESFEKKLLDQDPEEADFQNLISSSLTRYICEKTSRMKLLTDRETDRQTPGIT